jgi:hypothetical protein
VAARTQVSKSQCVQPKSLPGFYLRPDAAAALDRACAAFGKRLIVTGALRTYERQVELFTERYERRAWPFRGPYGDVRSWQGHRYVRVRGAAAAIPGTSNHGAGDAIDVKTRREAGDPPRSVAVVFTSWNDRDRIAFLAAAADHGWADDEGRGVKELWHLTYYPERDMHRSGGSTSKPSSGKRKPKRLKTLRRGSSGWQVRLLQHRLRGHGSYKGVVDEKFGPMLEAAVKRFQRDRGLTPDGVVGPHTWFELAQGAKAGESGQWRNQIAQRIAGFTGADADGIIGPKSVERFRQMQRWLGVSDDGVLGPQTIDAMKRKA